MGDVEAVLANYLPDFRPTSIEPLGSAGGMSGAQFWRGTSARGAMVLRRWPAEHPSPDRLTFIHGVLRHAASRGCRFLPVPVTTQTGQSFVSYAGHLWELAPWMPGIADYDRSRRSEKLSAAMRALASFHNAVTDFRGLVAPGSAGGANAVTRHLDRLQELTPEAIAALGRSITLDNWPDLAPPARQFVAALPTAIPKGLAQLDPLTAEAFSLLPCLRDIWHDHVLFTGNEVTGFVDFGAIAIDTPATDIARLLGSLASVTPLPDREGQGEGSVCSSPDQSQTWQTGLAAYNAIRALSPAETRAAYALHTSGTILAGCNWIRWIYIDRKAFDEPWRIVERFSRILDAITNG